MFAFSWIFIFFYASLNAIYFENYNDEQANISVILSGASYCGKEQYNTMKLVGSASEFVYTDTLYDIKTDLQGYIGYIKTKKTIYVALRGSSSVLNWLDDAEVKLVDYKSWPTCDCKVHNGFYRSALGVTNKTISSVKLLLKRFPDFNVIMTGHSYGASTVQLLSMELENVGITTEIYNFGQPRVGDNKYAGFVNTVISNYWRFTHNKDIVPHVPPIYGFGYLHSCREIYEDQNGNLKICSETNCEDPTCTDQYSLSETNSEDHSYYLGRRVDCKNSII